MELLAPAGSKESCITAIRAGANAVYVGLEGFNARIAAAGISLYDLQVLTDHARQNKVKVYVALNTLIKHEEIHAVVKSISLLDALRPDAVIVQDLGVAAILRTYFPDIPLHASTQMAVHNRMGVEFLAQNGFTRAILARELSFSELKLIANAAPVELEIFCHGALCFCVSGMCFFSSYIGGLSGNRGRCTQPCRRLWKNGPQEGYLFSPRDLELAEHITKLKKIGIACLKIEGRMRSSEYVYRVVRAYRLLIDAKEHDFPEALKEAKRILSGDMAREKTTCLFSGRDANLFQPKKAQCLGNHIGQLLSASGGELVIETLGEDAGIAQGDRLRISNPATDTTIAFKVKEFVKDGPRYTIAFGKAEGFMAGNPVFKTVDVAFDQKNIEEEIDGIYDRYKKENPRAHRAQPEVSQRYTALISNVWKENKKAPAAEEKKDTLWVRFDDRAWLGVMPRRADTRYIFSLTKDNLHHGAALPRELLSDIAGELTPFIAQRETEVFRQHIDKMIAAGVRRWVLNNVSQIGFFKEYGPDIELSAGHLLYTWNAYAAAFLSAQGFRYFTASWEDDFLNIRKRCAPGLGTHIVVYLYGLPALARSRMLTRDMLHDGLVSECSRAESAAEKKTAASFMPVAESGSVVLLPERPVSNFTARRKLAECGITNFGLDVSYQKPDKKHFAALLEAYAKNENILDSAKFNFKRGIQ